MIKLLNHSPNIQKEPKTHNKGYIRASYMQGLAVMPLSIAASGLIDKFTKSTSLTPEQNTEFANTINSALENSGLKEKGVNIIEVEPLKKNLKDFRNTEIGQEMFDVLKKRKIKDTDSFAVKQLKTLSNKASKLMLQIGDLLVNPTEQDKKVMDIFNKEVELNIPKALRNQKPQDLNGANKELIEKIQPLIQNANAIPQILPLKQGSNAMYLKKTKTILIPQNKLNLSVFHEMGHALNSNNVVTNALQKIRPLALMIPAMVCFVSLTNQRKNTDETSIEDSKLQKGRDFVKRNAGKLTALSALPIVVEEGLATLKGNKLAKNSGLSKELYKKVKTLNFVGLSSYITAAAIAGLGTAFAVKVKDDIQTKYEHKMELKAQKNSQNRE
jgi:hypothetical protein